MTDFTDPVTVQAALDASPFQRVLGLRLVALDPGAGRIVLDLPWHPGPARQAGGRQAGGRQVHGGVIAAVLDIAGDYALALGLGRFPATADLRCDFLRTAEGDLRAEAVVLRAGRRLGLADVTLADGAGRLVAVGRASYATGAG